jgi:hypothetical protein
MKLRMMVGSAFGLLAVVGFAYAQNMPDAAQPAAQQNVATQMNSSPSEGIEAYGGTPDTRIQSGARHARPCRVDPQCNLFFGGS